LCRIQHDPRKQALTDLTSRLRFPVMVGRDSPWELSFIFFGLSTNIHTYL
jgi:hypothetical protein